MGAERVEVGLPGDPLEVAMAERRRLLQAGEGGGGVPAPSIHGRGVLERHRVVGGEVNRYGMAPAV
jgi:hypothetical protein